MKMNVSLKQYRYVMKKYKRRSKPLEKMNQSYSAEKEAEYFSWL